MRQSVLEGIYPLWEERGFVEKLSGLEMTKALLECLFRQLS